MDQIKLKDKKNFKIDFTVSRAFNKPKEVFSIILTKILNESLDAIDFDKADILQSILSSIISYSSEKAILDSKIKNKQRKIDRLPRKRGYISKVGKIMCNILTSERSFSSTLLARRHECSWGFANKIVKFLKREDIDLKNFRKHYTPPRIEYDKGFKNELFAKIKDFIKNLPIPNNKFDLIYSYCKRLYSVAKEKGLTPEIFERGKNVESLSLILLFCSLRFNKIKNIENEFYSKNQLFDLLFPEKRSSAYDSNIRVFYPFLPSDFGISYRKLVNPSIIEYNNIKDLVEQNGGKLLSSKEDFRRNIIYFDLKPSNVPLYAHCEKSHRFFTNYTSLFHHHAWCPICNKDVSLVGMYIHPILEFYISKYLKSLGYDVYIESVLKWNSKRIDLRIKKGSNINGTSIFDKLPNYISEIMVDFTLAKRWITIRKKFSKYYLKNNFLIIVYLNGLNPYDLSKLNEEKQKFPFPKNIKIFSLWQFFDFLNIRLNVSKWNDVSPERIKIKNKFEGIIRLSESAMNSEKYLSKLSKLYIKYIRLVKKFK